MEKKRAMSRYQYTVPYYKSVTYTVNADNGKVTLTEFLNDLHEIQLSCIDEALESSDLRDAKEVIAHIRSKL